MISHWLRLEAVLNGSLYGAEQCFHIKQVEKLRHFDPEGFWNSFFFPYFFWSSYDRNTLSTGENVKTLCEQGRSGPLPDWEDDFAVLLS